MADQSTTKTAYDFNQEAKPEPQISYYKNGAIKEQCYIKNGELDGPYLAYYEAEEGDIGGQVSTKAFFKNGELDGSYASYDKNGKVTTIAHYKAGKLDGETKVYDNGHLLMIAQYLAGKKEGKLSFYGPHGKVTGEKPYKADKVHGTATYFNEQGQVVKTETYHDDELEGPATVFAFPPFPMERAYYKKGQVVEKITYSLEEKTRGKYQTKTLFKDGKEVGEPIPLDPETGKELKTAAPDTKSV